MAARWAEVLAAAACTCQVFVFGRRTCLRWEECVVWEEGGWGPRGKRCGAFQKDRFLWEIFPEIKVLSAEIRVRKYTYNRREILVWAKGRGRAHTRG